MSKIEINVVIDATNLGHVEAACVFMKTIGMSSEVAKPTPSSQSKPTGAKTPESKKTENKKDENSVSINDIRTLIQKKTKDPDKGDENRKSIKEKLTEFGANNASTLKEENYENFHKFLQELK